ncbi:unnamed protein product [Clonostachys chloroleuca]|uniref:PSP1 C-terminal domain-containing protein n=1 Tax=Clonostachys chloroleuca TaxID=1926264 RepID=A0AA35QAM6_9HYPO|nr:unnamed protein product [Clonostachys chloroleuca]
MSTGAPRPGAPSKSGQGPFAAGAQNSQSHLLEKVNARTSTPDSEALASSDDEADHRHESSQAAAHPHKPMRRSSWLNDTSQSFNRPRKGSFASGSMSPTASHPSTPSGEVGNASWGSHSNSSNMNRAPGGNNFPWGAGIWNNERKDPPMRLSEVLPSPTSTVPPGMSSNSFFGPEHGITQASPNTREPGSNSQIPFAIPLHPTPKTYRSQSYSVGQMELESAAPSSMSSSAVLGRARHPALQHRPSRPSMLSEMASDGSMLGKVKEVDDDEEEGSLSESMQGSFTQSAESKTIEMLARENALLRQQQYARVRPRAMTGTSYFGNGYSTVPEESDFAIDELDELNDGGESFARRAANSRRMSEYGVAPVRSPFSMDPRKVDNSNLKKALWSTSAYPLGDGSQSRRHSFANMPTRQGSISSIADTTSTLDISTPDGQQQLQDYVTSLAESNQGYVTSGNPASYIGAGPALGANIPPVYASPYGAPYGNPPPFVNRAPSPHRNVFGMAQPRHNQLLHMVLFKCARADVFYIQEGTGLTVKPGDLVIVEADRGTDLGTVAKDNVDWQTAKELKEHYAEEHYKWLMMYSQGAAAAQEGTGTTMLSSPNGLQGSAVGGMGPPTQHHMQEPNAGELRPKLIKRLAQSHEVHSLRDKEGQEAKAKRVCMQKVKEHGLNMEILDAEFQMDWKKLTFYYFADAYINFNSLVTDLFKIYKTRIWMSAINPASFASPTLGIQAPSGVGPGAVGVGRSSAGGERRQTQQPQSQQQQPQQQQQQPLPQQEQSPSNYGPRSQPSRGFQPTVNPLFTGERMPAAGTAYPGITYGYTQAGAFGNARAAAPFGQAISPSADGFPGAGFQQLGDFASMRQRFPSQPSPNPHAQGVSPISTQADWTSSFQGLSLNSH